jgi:guanylate kinase
MQKPGLLFVVAAPSGAGKTTLCKELMTRLADEGEPDLRWSCSYTTRKPRNGEVEGMDYFFVSDREFDRMIAAGEFAEWANVHGRRYGTGNAYLEQSRQEGVDLLLEIDIQGASQLKDRHGEGHYIFVLPPSWQELENRLRGRNTEDEDEVKRRLDRAREEILEWTWFDYIIVNDDFKRAVDRMNSIVVACRHARSAMGALASRIVDGAHEAPVK